MRKLYTLLALMIVFSLNAQNNRIKGERFPNEMGQLNQELSLLQKMEKEIKVEEETSFNSSFKRDRRETYPDWDWQNNRDYSEIFIRVPERGYFTIELNDQMVGNRKGMFRFFDVNAGTKNISIYKNGYLVYRTKMRVRSNSRILLDFFTRDGLYLVDILPINNQRNNIPWNPNKWEIPSRNNSYYGNVMNNVEFNQFFNYYKEEGDFDRERVSIIENQMQSSLFTAGQIRDLLKEFSFDSSRLEIAKHLFDKCVDRQNFYIVYDVFDFNSNKNELRNYTSGRR
ncbi:DUF4476 domain-containing protein [Weeksellaceae bacterium TAE3-ERU29]|nr:DUF4476 domain-containing protein [Weeksellaceae bacterium TAE3-ERU29]